MTARGIFLVLAVMAMGSASAAMAETPRSSDVPRQFMHIHPCPGGPDKGHTTGACHGYVRDHIIPLCKNGPDTVANLQWQTVADGHAKDRWECR
jgi:hypothetical protein